MIPQVNMARTHGAMASKMVTFVVSCYNNNNTTGAITMKINALPPTDYLAECFDYDLDSGLLWWRERPASHFTTSSKHKRFITLSAGTEVGTFEGKGYKVVRLTYLGKHRSYRVHRICYALVHGDTEQVIDHINGDRQDNRISNLRAVTFSENVANQTAPKKQGLKGACWDRQRGKWLASIKRNYKTIYIGRFDTEQEAHDAYRKARTDNQTLRAGPPE